jgi:hypothetical protein
MPAPEPPYLGHKNKLYPSFSPSITVTASLADNAIIREKEAIANMTAMFVYILLRADQLRSRAVWEQIQNAVHLHELLHTLQMRRCGCY